MRRAILAQIPLVICLACSQALAQQLDFENLPSVAPEDNSAMMFEDNDNGSDAECTTAFEPLGLEDNTPKRVYKCKTGNITITSEDPPLSN
ncbi:hypothetical protein [uncultured Hoeflea sp.]|uniref:hypothetical protein n=1 Tax=uncultured Hoeflea sp. TaxID=538666 RepID=UPI002608A318|nr:hypothetical protein [uncultured Hoeflea sp.]